MWRGAPTSASQRLVVFPREGGSVIHERGHGARLTPRAIPEIRLDVDALFAAGEL
jgi:hypothetical protein